MSKAQKQKISWIIFVAVMALGMLVGTIAPLFY